MPVRRRSTGSWSGCLRCSARIWVRLAANLLCYRYVLTFFLIYTNRNEQYLCTDKRNVPCLKIPAPSAAMLIDLPMHIPISQFWKVLAQFSELSAVYFAQPCTFKCKLLSNVLQIIMRLRVLCMEHNSLSHCRRAARGSLPRESLR